MVWANSPFDVIEVQLGTFRHDSCPQFSGDFYRYAPHSDHLFADHHRHGAAGWLDSAGGQAYAQLDADSDQLCWWIDTRYLDLPHVAARLGRIRTGRLRLGRSFHDGRFARHVPAAESLPLPSA